MDTKSTYNKLAASYRPAEFWATHEWNVQVIAARGKKAQEKAAEQRAKEEAKKPGEGASKEARASSNTEQTIGQQDVDAEDKGPAAASLSPDRMDVDSSHAPTSKDTHHEVDQPQNHYEGMHSAKQLPETVSDFLARLPPSTSRRTIVGPWIWIANPYPPDRRRSNNPESGDGDIATFRQLGSRLLDNYTSRREQLESQNPDKAEGSITRMLRQDRLILESDIKDLAKEQKVTAGKWMLFPSAREVDRAWAVVARGVWEGKLGTGAKVATAVDDTLPASKDDASDGNAGDGDRRLVCIYTYDFTDRNDVQRVLVAMKELGLLDRDAGGGVAVIYYKCDAYTYLDISSGNEYKLKASLWSSRDLMPQWYNHGGGGGGRGNGRGRGGGRGGWRGAGRGRGFR